MERTHTRRGNACEGELRMKGHTYGEIYTWMNIHTEGNVDDGTYKWRDMHMKGHTHGGTYAWRDIYMDQHRYGGECTRKDIHAEEYTHRGDVYSIQTVDILHHLLEGLSTRWNARPTVYGQWLA